MRHGLVLFVLVWLTACAVGPDYRRPDIDLPKSKFDSTLLSQQEEQAMASWWARYRDPVLNRLIDEALDSNLRIALQAQRVRQARAALGLANAQLYPTISGQAQAMRQRTPFGSSVGGGSSGAGGGTGSTGSTGTTGVSSGNSSGPGGPVGSNGLGGGSSGGGGGSVFDVFTVAASFNYELDIFGGLRRADEQARAQLLSSAYTQDSIRLTVVSDVVTNYFSLRALERQIRVTRQTIQTRMKGLHLDQQRYKYGAIDKLTLLQTKSLLQSARAQLPPLEQQRATLLTSLAILTGKTPRQIYNNAAISAGSFQALTLPKTLPKVLPSLLVNRRPDVRAAEASLIAANANVGVAKARFFPTFNLTAMVGNEALHIGDLFDSASALNSAGGSIVAPILDFGRRNAQFRSALAQKRQAEISYRQTLRQAFKGVRDALSELTYSRQRLTAVQRQLAAYRETLKLARLRYKVGRTNFFNVLDAQRNVFNTQLNLATAIRNRFTATANLFKALGGGWTYDSDSLPPDLQAVSDRYQTNEAK